MEDTGTDFGESLVPPLNHNSEDESKREDVKEKELEGCFSTKKEENIGGGGLINNLISTLTTPLSPSIGKGTEHESVDVDGDRGDEFEAEKGGVGGGGEGGLISKMVSNFFHQSEGVVETEKDKEEEELMVGEKIKRQKTEDGGFIHNIVSLLPDSITDDAVPTAYEATILINSLVRD